MDALYFRVSSERQTTENQFEDLLQIAEKDATGTVYRVRPEIAAELARQCVYVEQGKSSKAGSRRRPLFEQMKAAPEGPRPANSIDSWFGKYPAWGATCGK
jgi:DNA invertase Pin-like site-specific DNA recombinase